MLTYWARFFVYSRIASNKSMISQSQSEEWPKRAAQQKDYTGPFFFLYRNQLFKTLRFFFCWLLISNYLRAGHPPRPAIRIPLRRSPTALARYLGHFCEMTSHSHPLTLSIPQVRPISLRQIGYGEKSFVCKSSEPIKTESLALTK